MRIIETPAYTFAELSDEAKEKAVNSLRNINVWDRFWHEHITDGGDCNELNENQFIEVKDIRFSGFSSQGDGASFCYNTTEDLWKAWVYLTFPDGLRQRLLLESEVYVEGVRNGRHYVHENSISHYVDTSDPDSDFCHWPNIVEFFETVGEKFQNEVGEIARELMQDLYRTLEGEYDYQTSDQCVIDGIETNGYEFTEDGEQI